MMKNKTLLSLAFFLITLQFTNAQSQQFKEMKHPYFEASASIGLVPTFVKDISSSEIPPIGLTLDYRINRRFSVGIFGGYTKAMSHPDMLNDGKPMTFNTQFSMIGGRFAVHSTKFERWDVYGGMGINYTHSNIDVIDGDLSKLKKHKHFKTSSGKMMMSAFIGTKYAVTPKVSIFGEVGYGISLINLGVSKRF
jgi:hypothetical protein